MQKTSEDTVLDCRRFGRVQHFDFLEHESVTVDSVVSASVLLDSDIPEADNERFDGLNGWLIVDDRFGRRAGHGRRSLTIRFFLALFRHPAFNPPLNNNSL